MRDIVSFRTGPDGSLILAPTPGEGTDDDEISVELRGRTIEISTPDGGQEVGLELVHGNAE
jgi:hypothetical protein